MITSDQPTIFGDAVVIAVSSVDDGNMRFDRGDDNETRTNRVAFLEQNGIDPLATTLVQVSYANTTDFARYHVVDEDRQGEGMLAPESDLVADALVVVRPGHGLFLPLADCCGVVLYDPKNEILMVSHIGRHSVEISGATKSVHYMQEQFGSVAADLLVWLSPAVGSETYPLHNLDNRGLQEVIHEQLLSAGVAPHHIEVSDVDTAQTDSYFSHSEFVAGNRTDDGRFAVVAMMRE